MLKPAYHNVIKLFFRNLQIFVVEFVPWQVFPAQCNKHSTLVKKLWTKEFYKIGPSRTNVSIELVEQIF